MLSIDFDLIDLNVCVTLLSKCGYSLKDSVLSIVENMYLNLIDLTVCGTLLSELRIQLNIFCVIHCRESVSQFD